MKKNIKKILLFIVITILFSSQIVMASDINMSLTGPTSATKGEEIEIGIVCAGNTNGILGIEGNLTFDNTALEYESCSGITGWNTPSYDSSTGKFLMEISDLNSTTYSIKTSTTVMKLKFKIKSTFSNSTTKLSLTNVVQTDSTYAAIKGTDASFIVNISSGTTTNNTTTNTTNSTTTNNTTTNNNVTNTTTNNTTTGTTNNTTTNNSSKASNSNLYNNTTDTTTAKSILPKTGTTAIIVVVIGIATVGGVISYKKYKEYKKL